MFDLPVGTSSEKRTYRHFRKKLIRSGFMMLQESVYCKLVPNWSAAEYVIENLKKDKPEKGSVMALKITEKQYARTEYIVGKYEGNVINSDERLVII